MKKIKIYKFGGASIKDVSNIKNIINILKYVKYNNTIIIFSAIGKITNKLEELLNLYIYNNKKLNINNILQTIFDYHINIVYNLFPTNHSIFNDIKIIYNKLLYFINYNKNKTNYNFLYDQIVSYGELFSTKIISEFLNFKNIYNILIDVRQYIKTDNFYREANINWEKTKLLINKLDLSKTYVTQGFLGSDNQNFTTTLGREGSDYTASIFSYCLNASEQIIWKDVPGILNADPRYFSNTKILQRLSYKEAIELSYYGASVIHPKTLEPLQEKKIPLYVKSFIDPHENGSIIMDGVNIYPNYPCYIVKNKQILIFLNKNSFLIESDFKELFNTLNDYNLKINLVQNSATNFNICINDKFNKLNFFVKNLSYKYNIKVLKKVTLYTIRHYDDNIIKNFCKHKCVLLKQFTLSTAQWIVKE